MRVFKSVLMKFLIWCIKCLLSARPAAPALHPLHLRDVQERLNAAAQIHDGEHADADLTEVVNKRVVRHKGHERHRWQVVHHNDAEVDQHYLEGFLFHRVHHLFSCHGAPQHPDDGNVAVHHDCESKKDDSTEDVGHAQGSQNGLGERVSQDEAPGQHGHADAGHAVSVSGENHRVNDGHVTVHTDAHLQFMTNKTLYLKQPLFLITNMSNVAQMPKIL